jgi:hypothetical protein
LASIGFFILLAILYFGYFDSPLESHANPQKTPLDTKAPWYFWWLQGMLKIDPAAIFESMINPIIQPIGEIFGRSWSVELSKLLNSKFIMGLMIPPGLLILLMAIPYIDRNPSRLAKNRPFAIAWGLAWIFILLALSYMGLPVYGIETPAATRVIQDLAPEEGLGPLREIPHEELLAGIYQVDPDYDGSDLCPTLVYFAGEFKEVTNTSYYVAGENKALITDQTNRAGEIFEGYVIVQAFLTEDGDLEAHTIRLADEKDEYTVFGCPHLTEVYAQFSERLQIAEEEGELPDLEAYILIEDFQHNLKLVVPHVQWTDEDGEPQTYEVEYFLHQEGWRED